jgi:hypothetical protein
MRTPSASYISSVLATAESPCVSIYFPAAGAYPDSQQDANRYRNLVGRAEAALTRSHPGPAGRDLVDRLRGLERDAEFWGGVKHGVAVLASPVRFDAFTLPRSVPERVEVGESFHVKPLLRIAQSADPFHVLCVSRERVALFEGNRYELRPLKVPGVPLTFDEALGEEVEEPVRGTQTAGPDSTTRPNARTGGEGAHGHLVGKGQAVRKIAQRPEAERFFREVDREVVARVSEPAGLPVIPVGIDDNLSEFRRLSKNRFLTAEGVSGDWTNWSLPEIRERAWKVFEKHYLADLATIREDFGTARARGQATADLADAARAVVMNRVGILLIDADRTVPGAIDMGTGELHPAPAGDAAAGDMLDDLAEMALKIKARVVVTPAANVPTDTGLAAIFRY